MTETKPAASPSPIVSIGLPVYNGETFLKDTLESILQQTFSNFELIISDNASTDATEKICKSFVSKDERIRYHRNESNLGAAKNYNQLVDMAKGEYFKWAAADDLIAPEYLTLCVDVLDNNPDILISQTTVRLIDENSQHIKDYDDHLHFISELPHVRLNNYLFRKVGMWNAIFGLIRIDQLRETPLIGTYISSDQVLLGELILRGKVHQIPKRLFSRRIHSRQADGSYNSKLNSREKAREALAIWFDPNNKGKYQLPKYIQHLLSYMNNTYRVSLSWDEKLLSYFCILKWAFDKLFWSKIIRRVKKII